MSLPNELGIGPLDHIGVAVHSIEAALPFWSQGLALETHAPEELPAMGLRVQKVVVGGAKVELIEPTRDGTAIAKFLETRGPGLHHLCFRVLDIDAAAARMVQEGYRALSEAPQDGADGCRVLFLHPADTGGVLVELSQAP
jgi:methylmalonyl-CoA epimerase